MSVHRRALFVIVALTLSGAIRGWAQPATVDAIVAQFYPQSLVDLAGLNGRVFDRKQCYAVFDRDLSGAPRTIVAAYTNNSSAVVRVLRADAAGGFAVMAEPHGYDFSGSNCSVKLVDLDKDSRNEVFVTFSAMVSSVSWVFRWDDQQLTNLTPVTTDPDDGTLETDLYRAEILDVDNDGIQEIYVTSQYPPPLDEPAKPDVLYRLQGDRYVEAETVVGLWTFTRSSRAPETVRVQAPLPAGMRGPYTLHLVNGVAGGGSRVTSAEVWLNDQQVLGPSDFGNRVDVIDRAVTLSAENDLAVRLAGAPGSKFLLILKPKG